MINRHNDMMDNDTNRSKYLCKMNGNEINEFLTYNQIMDRIDEYSNDNKIWKFNRIIYYRGPFTKEDNDYKGSKYNLSIKWTNGDVTEEPLSIIGTNDPISCSQYAEQNGMLGLDGWKIFRKYINCQYINVINVNINKLRTFINNIKYMFGLQIPRNYL